MIFILVKFSLILNTLHTLFYQCSNMFHVGYHLIDSLHFKTRCWNRELNIPDRKGHKMGWFWWRNVNLHNNQIPLELSIIPMSLVYVLQNFLTYLPNYDWFFLFGHLFWVGLHYSFLVWCSTFWARYPKILVPITNNFL